MHPRRLAPSFILGLLAFGGAALVASPPPDPRHKLVLQTPPTTTVSSVAVSPDGSLVATAAAGGVRLCDAKTGAHARSERPTTTPASRSSNGRIRGWMDPTSRHQQNPNLFTQHVRHDSTI